MKRKCINWAIVATMERPDGTWYTDTITDIDDDTASSVDQFLTNMINDKWYDSLEAEIVRLKSLLKGKNLDLKSAEEVRLSHAKKITYLQSELRQRGKSNDSK